VYLVKQKPDEPALVARVLQGDTAAFEELLKPHEAALFTLACRMLGDREEARDALQSALLRAYQHLAQFNPAHRFFSWMYRIVMNECLNRRRDRVPEDELPPTLAASGTPFEAAAASERAAQVRRQARRRIRGGLAPRIEVVADRILQPGERAVVHERALERDVAQR